MPSSRTALAERTVDRIRDSPNRRALGMPELVRLMRSLSSPDLDIEVPVLGAVIQKDPVIMARVLGAAQTLAYNVSAGRVSTVDQAIHIIGYARVRALSLSFVIAEASSGGACEEHRQAAAIAICSGFIAELAARHYRVCDREEAFICACLRNLGRIFLAALLSDEYHSAVRMPGHSPEEGCRRVFGLTPLELGRELLRTEQVHETLMVSQAEFEPQDPAFPPGDSDANQLLAICDFSTRLAEIALQPALGADGCARKIAALAARYEAFLPALEPLIAQFLAHANEQLRLFMRERGITSLPLRSVHRFNDRAAEFARFAAGFPAAVSPSELQPSFSLEAGVAGAVACLRARLEATDTLLFACDPGRAQFDLAEGSGSFFWTLSDKAVIRPAERTVMGICLKYRESVLIHDANEPKIRPHLPDWIKGEGAPQAFALFPLVGAAGPCGIVVVGWPLPLQIEIPESIARSISHCFSALCRYCDRNRGAAGLYRSRHAPSILAGGSWSEKR